MGNIFADWTQNGVGNWNKMNQEANAPAQQWATESMKNNNVQDLTAPQQPVTPPYNPGVQVVQPQKTVVQQQKQQTQPVLNGNSSTAGMDYLNSLYTSPQEEERLRKASAMNQKILAIGDALRHIGNIYNTVNYAPAQQLNNPVVEEQARYERGKALRDRANQQYFAYQQAKAAQDAKARQWEAEQKQKADQWNATFKYNAARDAARLKNAEDQWRTTLDYKAKNDDANRAQRQKQYDTQNALRRQSIGIQAQNAQTNKRRADAYINKLKNSGVGGTSGIAPLDTPNGQITPNGRSYSNQLLQMFDYAKSKGYVKETDVAKRLRELGFGKDQSDNVKRQMVMDLLRTNQDMGDYAANRLGWSYGAGGGGMDLGLEDEEDEMDLGLD